MALDSIPKGYKKKKSAVIPYGYKLSLVEGYLEPIPLQLEELKKNLYRIYNKESSLREAALLLTEFPCSIPKIPLYPLVYICLKIFI